MDKVHGSADQTYMLVVWCTRGVERHDLEEVEGLKCKIASSSTPWPALESSHARGEGGGGDGGWGEGEMVEEGLVHLSGVKIGGGMTGMRCILRTKQPWLGTREKMGKTTN